MNTYPLEKYKEDLLRADWHYEYAEGYQHQQGREEMERLRRIAKQSPEHDALFSKVWDLRKGRK